MFSLLKNIVQFFAKPFFTLFFFVITLSVFIFQAKHYHFILDDNFFLTITENKGYWECLKFFYLSTNGRWFSNIFTSSVFSLLGHRYHLYWYIHLLQFFIFIFSVSFFFNSLLHYLGAKKMNLMHSLQIGTFFTCLFFWFYFDARIEVWYWEASCLVHLICLICMFFMYGILFHKTFSNGIKITLLILLSLFIGGSSETFALACMIISVHLLIRNRNEKKFSTWLHLVIVLFIGISLAINYFSPGTAVRTGYLPEPKISEGLKNMVYTFYLQLKKVKHLPFKAVGIFLLWPLSLQITKISGTNMLKSFTLNKFDQAIIVLLILENTFFPAYSIFEETPDRVFAFNWLLALLLFLNYILKKKKFITYILT